LIDVSFHHDPERFTPVEMEITRQTISNEQEEDEN